jgi:hypothetical protein
MVEVVTGPSALSALLEPYPRTVQEIVHTARRLLLAVLPGATEVIDSKARVIGYGYGTGYRDMICTLILSKRGVKLGLVGGASLPDPQHLLQGEGKVHRHVPLTRAEDLRRKGIKPLLRASLAAWRQRSRDGAAD